MSGGAVGGTVSIRTETPDDSLVTGSLIPDQEVLTPTLGVVARRSLFWVGVAVFLVLVAVVSFAIAGSGATANPLDPTSAGAEGTMALAEVLRQQGVVVTPTSTLSETRSRIVDRAATTLVIYDSADFLDDTRLREAVQLADRVIVLDASFSALSAVAPSVAQAGKVTTDLTADCPLAAVKVAKTVSGSGSGYRVLGSPSGVTGCLASGDGVFSLVQIDRSASTLVLLGATGSLTNSLIADQGNAAFAVTLMGESRDLVWYLPSVADLPGGDAATVAALTPRWVIPVMLLLVVTTIAAGIWRGRRLGPLVFENLPVTVRANETMIGRSRLYDRANSRLRALDALRIGSIERLARVCGLPRSAGLPEVIGSVSALSGLPAREVSDLLVDARPANDRDLLRLSDRLLEMERVVADAARP